MTAARRACDAERLWRPAGGGDGLQPQPWPWPLAPTLLAPTLALPPEH